MERGEVSYLGAGQRKILISSRIRNVASHVLTARIEVTIITTLKRYTALRFIGQAMNVE